MSKRSNRESTPPPTDPARVKASAIGLPQLTPDVSCCDGGPSAVSYTDVSRGTVATPVGEIPKVATQLDSADRLGRWKARWAIGRMKYAVAPDLYAVGNPSADSMVFISANYKMSFDHLRSDLHGRDAWIMVLDTKGINVWCAAGKGSFGTDEIVRRIKSTRLAEIVSHRKLILPQLGAPGVSAHKVKDRTGFRVIYGPIRAADIPAFLDAGLKVTTEMRLVRFGLYDRLVLIPVELVMSAKYLLAVAAALFVLSGLGRDLYSFDRVMPVGLPALLLLLAANFAGGTLTPTFLPWLPGRSFALKGAMAGLVVVLIAGLYGLTRPVWPIGDWDTIAWALMIPSIASFIGMNFTGASTYTSLSGVRREMRVAVPLQIISAAAGLVLWVTARFVQS